MLSKSYACIYQPDRCSPATGLQRFTIAELSAIGLASNIIVGLICFARIEIQCQMPFFNTDMLIHFKKIELKNLR